MSSTYLFPCIFTIFSLFFSSSSCLGISWDEYLTGPLARPRPLSRDGHVYYSYNGNLRSHGSSSIWNIARGRRSRGYWHTEGGEDSDMAGTRFGGDVANSANAISRYLKSVKVDDYGAEGDGRADDTETVCVRSKLLVFQAFKEAWKVACSMERGVFVVPSNGIYHLKQITFSGPCKSGFKIKIYGKLIASDDPSDYGEDPRQWLVFENLDDLRVEGGGTIDGNGQSWWLKSCKVDTSLPCKVAPTAVTFYNCNNLRVADLTLKDAQQMHLTFQNSENVRATNLRITAPESSPNTDGIHIAGTQNILIDNCLIETGDDCVSVVSGSQSVEVANIKCGPGHGISIGSLGADNSEDYVSDVYVHGARLSGTTNGVRIKTWQGGSGYAKNIRFQNIVMNNVTNPIIIDQNYCDRDEPCQEQRSAVQVSNVVYRDIRGTSASEVAMKFDCSKSHPCREISLQGINLRSQVRDRAEASCVNVDVEQDTLVFPTCP